MRKHEQPMSPRDGGGRWRTVALAVGVALLIAGCGRSAPEGASQQTETDGVEPQAAGIQFSTADSIVAPAPLTTTTTIATTTTVGAAGTYVVEAGDTLSVVAEQFGISTQQLSDANGITDVNSIQPGQELIIPAPTVPPAPAETTPAETTTTAAGG